MHDQTTVKTKGIQDLLDQHPTVTATVDGGYQGRQGVRRPAPRPATQSQAKTRQPSRSPSTRPAPKQQSSRRICVEHAIAEAKQWRSLQRGIGRRHYDAQAHLGRRRAGL
jgi:hypothetical protein